MLSKQIMIYHHYIHKEESSKLPLQYKNMSVNPGRVLYNLAVATDQPFSEVTVAMSLFSSTPSFCRITVFR